MSPVTGHALAPLAARYQHWLGLDAAQVLQDRDEAAEDIRALQLIVRMERDSPPSWHAALALAAQGSAAICLDARSAPEGEWFDAVKDYCRGHIRKVTRRARGAQWDAVQELPGLTLTSGTTQVRALLPGRVADLDKRVARLQVGGTDVDPDDATSAPAAGALQIWLPPEPVMTLGKPMAQAGHAGMIAAALLAESDPSALQGWMVAGLPTVVERASAHQWTTLAQSARDPAGAWGTHRLLAVRDAGFTEVAPGTVTVIGKAPTG